MALLAGKRIIITGAASGIGRATSILAAEEGAHVIAVDLSDDVHQTVTAITAAGGSAFAEVADASREDDVRRFVMACTDRWGGIDGIYANAGVRGAGKPLTELNLKTGSAPWL